MRCLGSNRDNVVPCYVEIESSPNLGKFKFKLKNRSRHAD
jgi:hypothetical protein